MCTDLKGGDRILNQVENRYAQDSLSIFCSEGPDKGSRCIGKRVHDSLLCCIRIIMMMAEIWVNGILLPVCILSFCKMKEYNSSPLQSRKQNSLEEAQRCHSEDAFLCSH